MRNGVRRTTVREVLELALELERQTMALYAGFVQHFGADDELRQFWFSMARNEASHCGALLLVESILENHPELSGEAKILFDTTTGVRLRSLLIAYRRELKRGVSAERAFEMAIDLESSELEDVVVDLLQIVRDPGWRDQAVKMLIHDMGEMSYMIEKRTQNERLLQRADALVERRIGRPPAAKLTSSVARTRRSTAAPKIARPTK